MNLQTYAVIRKSLCSLLYLCTFMMLCTVSSAVVLSVISVTTSCVHMVSSNTHCICSFSENSHIGHWDLLHNQAGPVIHRSFFKKVVSGYTPCKQICWVVYRWTIFPLILLRQVSDYFHTICHKSWEDFLRSYPMEDYLAVKPHCDVCCGKCRV